MLLGFQRLRDDVFARSVALRRATTHSAARQTSAKKLGQLHHAANRTLRKRRSLQLHSAPAARAAALRSV